MKILENTLESLDGYFSNKQEREKNVMIVGVAAFVAFLGYYTLLPTAKAMHTQSVKKKASVEKNINEHRSYLSSITVDGDKDYYVKQYDQEIATKEKEIKDYTFKIAFIDESILKLSDMIFNKKSWSTFLNSITDRAESNGIDIISIANNYVDSNNSFGHVLEIHIASQGEYKQMLKFINELEQNRLVTDVYRSVISPTRDESIVSADINVSVWGVNH
ncbi:MAG TPA: hypothetical protein ENN12_03305 [Epsilonproteobacteria bacterium]|nr:hypothetical protein [Campylobacterota bacterium]